MCHDARWLSYCWTRTFACGWSCPLCWSRWRLVWCDTMLLSCWGATRPPLNSKSWTRKWELYLMRISFCLSLILAYCRGFYAWLYDSRMFHCYVFCYLCRQALLRSRHLRENAGCIPKEVRTPTVVPVCSVQVGGHYFTGWNTWKHWTAMD